MVICVCHRISDRDIARAVQQGCSTFEELQFELAVATCCGKCHDCARETLERCSRAAGTDFVTPAPAHPAASVTA
jgi:bacterioferritin-associated ferredoxin